MSTVPRSLPSLSAFKNKFSKSPPPLLSNICPLMLILPAASKVRVLLPVSLKSRSVAKVIFPSWVPVIPVDTITVAPLVKAARRSLISRNASLSIAVKILEPFSSVSSISKEDTSESMVILCGSISQVPPIPADAETLGELVTSKNPPLLVSTKPPLPEFTPPRALIEP